MGTSSGAARIAAVLGVGPGASARRSLLLLVLFLLGAGGTAAALAPAGPGPGSRGVGAGSGPEGLAAPIGLPRAAPVRIAIPAVGLDTPIVSVGFVGGRLADPPARRAGWYARGTSPGEPGSAVLLGSLTRLGQGPAGFAGLAALSPGDLVEVARADGVTARFRVDRVAPYQPLASLPSPAGLVQLRLVGTVEVAGPWPPPIGWDGPDNQPELVVFATLAH